MGKLSAEYLTRLTELSGDYDLITAVQDLDAEHESLVDQLRQVKETLGSTTMEYERKLADLRDLNAKLVLKVSDIGRMGDPAGDRDKVGDFFDAMNKHIEAI